ncbi:MAG: NUDIX hydrolase [Deltaproteobacteria bacterium]|nr:NUDIX hydrolase [Deltaproteobacteria bacterium]MBW1928848.1 NUDIX hydrolase [Deltaproteobacteria bacterium]MBW2026593.1 NUDIX hydrolase [Deltaproteobacteria bacterium]MBW2126746.1 NUDIX hydrolase [Deltaproteobacteria bacterium]RLB16893.1 MAG: NUDIX hydrolase [Deltaproteobacteria bacterium]
MHHHDPEFHFCPVCGGKLESKLLRGREPKRLVCPQCEFVFYLDPKVVACAIVEMEGGLVLVRRSIEPQKGKWVMPGGYVDRGEEVPTAAIRETQEECGLSIKIVRLLGVYSYQGKLQVVVVYLAEPLDGTFQPGEETSEVRVFSPAEIPWEDLAFQSTIDALKDYCRMKED